MTTNDPDNAPDEHNENNPEEERDGVSGLQVVQSTLAAALGVQSSKNRKRDFSQGKPSQFIIAGILFTALFVGLMVLLVNVVLS